MNYIEVSKTYARTSKRPVYISVDGSIDNLKIYKRGKKVPNGARFYVPAAVNNEELHDMATLQEKIEKLNKELDKMKAGLIEDAEAYNSLGNELSYTAKATDGVAATVSYANSLKVADKQVTGNEPFLCPKPVTYEVRKCDKEAILLIMTDACKAPCRCHVHENFDGWEMSTTGDVIKDADEIQRTINCPRDEAIRLAELYLKYENGKKVFQAAKSHGLSYNQYVKQVKEAISLGHSTRVTIATTKK